MTTTTTTTTTTRSRIAAAVIATTSLLLLAAAAVLLFAPGFLNGNAFMEISFLKYGEEGLNNTLTAAHRKLLRGEEGVEEPNRIWGEKCSRSDILINQGPTSPLPNGIPTYTVEIMNVCVTGCDISHIHLNCGWFSSARLVNPRVFKRLRYNDCLVNDGKPLVNGGTLSFQYANTFLYPLKVSHVACY